MRGFRHAIAGLFAVLPLVGQAGADGTDRRILPVAPAYARNPACAPVSLTIPFEIHTGTRDVGISPSPKDLPLNQGESAICFAYATADMISHRVGKSVSPLDVATKFYFADPARLEAIADPHLKRHLRAHPAYRADIAWSRNNAEVTKDGNPSLEPYFDKIEGGEEDTAALLYNIGGYCEDRDLPSNDGYRYVMPALRALRYRTKLRPTRQSFRAVAATATHLRGRWADPFNAAWIAHVETACRRTPLPVPLLPVSYRVAASQADFADMIESGRHPSRPKLDRILAMVDYALDHGRVPTVGYSWYLLEDRDPKDPDLFADHASPVIGRRKAGDVCQYRIQDNTGEYCGRMRDGIRERCDNGRIWVTESELRRTLYSVTYLR
ncbi:hypothetical protein [Methylobacterium sp. WL19]|uniref:hypothetical protein n=1 Tax=Methylobacterium sp. WL19 TaxID=2603896 RepID=UPI0007006ED3|nr:hypothetical protein [Methylobacterium sp. WL19]KQO54756.1 hypothetical protein ASF08_01430 [Methylobacterium sp. Leaf85]TXN29610.1 hypothetical protein FV220_07035 [Methylobacterium sp. WL19]